MLCVQNNSCEPWVFTEQVNHTSSTGIRDRGHSQGTDYRFTWPYFRHFGGWGQDRKGTPQGILKRLGIFLWAGFLVHSFVGCWKTREVCTHMSTHISWLNSEGRECCSQCSRLPWSGSGCSVLCLGWASAVIWFLSETQLERHKAGGRTEQAPHIGHKSTKLW